MMRRILRLLGYGTSPSSYHAPTVGPILGAVATNSVRIFCQWRPESGLGYCLLMVWSPGPTTGGTLVAKKVIRLNPNFAHSCVFVLECLAAGQQYYYQVGTFVAESDEAARQWTNQHSLAWDSDAPRFWTRRDTNTCHRLALGSCRYALRIGSDCSDVFLFDDRSDKAYRSMLRIHEVTPLDNLVFVGDQIYADDLNALKTDVSFPQYCSRYEALYATYWFRRLCARVPSVNTLDDHEIEDSYPAKADRKKLLTKVPAALQAFEVFQMSYSRLYDTRGGKIVSRPDHYWYSFRDGFVDYFVTDTRTERVLSQNETQARLMSDEQMDALLDWVADDSQCLYKVVLAAVPLVPVSKGTLHGFEIMRDGMPDKWDVSRKQMERFLTAIDKADRRVVVLSGDIHISTVGEVRGKRSMFHNIVSSPIYWPYPHGSSRDFHLHGTLADGFQYTCIGLVTTDSFAVVEFRSDALEVSFWPRKLERDAADPLFKYTHQYQSPRSQHKVGHSPRL